jgi:Dyp-type peroxidase family
VNPAGGGLDRRQIQGLVASGFGQQKAADFLPLSIDDAPKVREWLAAFLERLTTSEERASKVKRCLAFSASGLVALGLSKETMEGFSKEFREGMFTPHRQRILGDLPESPSDPYGWAWGGPRNPPVDALLMIYAPVRAACNEVVAEEQGKLRGFTVQRTLSSVSLGGREHFGFMDGLSNPYVRGLHEDGWPDDELPAGELLLGYPDTSGAIPSSPAVPRAGAPRLPVCPTDPRQSDFGRNGTYLVFRQIEQDVPAFWKGVAHATAAAGLDPSQGPEIAAKLIGRQPDGTPLPAVAGPANRRGQQGLTFADDPVGLRCPVGAHIRRANPRDALVENPKQSRQIVRAHRILRRGRAYGRPGPADWYPPGLNVVADDDLPADPAAGEGARGLYFICMCTDLGRQFEFVQQTWMNNEKFGGLFNATDPLSSGRTPEGHFTVARTPVRLRLSGFPPATRTAGGAYLMLPSRSALEYLAGIAER